MIHAAPVEICEVDEGEPIIQCSVTSEFAVVNVYNARLDIINWSVIIYMQIYVYTHMHEFVCYCVIDHLYFTVCNCDKFDQ